MTNNWRQVKLGEVVDINSKSLGNNTPSDFSFYYIDLASVDKGVIKFPKDKILYDKAPSRAKRVLTKNDILFSTVRPNLGGHAIFNLESDEYICSTGFAVFIYKYLLTSKVSGYINSLLTGSNYPAINASDLTNLKLLLPPLPEQHKIVEVLEKWDTMLEKLDALIAAKRELKKGLMQELLTGKRRLPGFDGEWREVKLGEIAICLDNKRVPLNSEQRSEMKGGIPYLGANGVVDYINDFIFDEDIILIAEDGGKFNDFQNRPVAYKFHGKSWVNNHAHVVKSKKEFSHDLLFYLSVHKNLLPYLSGGTRQKLNKSDLLKVKFWVPSHFSEQQAIAEILSTADAEIDALVAKREAIALERKYLLENLVTGKIRVV
jgi:type I restriction enzyme S subunit